MVCGFNILCVPSVQLLQCPLVGPRLPRALAQHAGNRVLVGRDRNHVLKVDNKLTATQIDVTPTLATTCQGVYLTADHLRKWAPDTW